MIAGRREPEERRQGRRGVMKIGLITVSACRLSKGVPVSSKVELLIGPPDPEHAVQGCRYKLQARIVVIDCTQCSQSPSTELDMLAPTKFDDDSNPLHAFRSLDGNTIPDERFDGLTRLARRHFGVTLALIMRVDGQRRWFCSCDGPAADRAFALTPDELSICG